MANHRLTVASGVRGLAILRGTVIVGSEDTFVVTQGTYDALSEQIADGALIDNGTTTDDPTFEEVDAAAAEAGPVAAEVMVAVSDETTAITPGAGKVTFRMPYAMEVSEVRASLNDPSTAGGPVTVDITAGGVSIFSTPLTIDNTETTSVTATTAAVISGGSLSDNAEVVIDVDTAGTGATGLKVTLIGTRV